MKRCLPSYTRSLRLIGHLFFPWRDPYLYNLIHQKRIGLFILHWSLELPLLALDMIGMPEWFTFFQSRLKSSARKLNDQEIELARFIFGSVLDLSRARIDEQSKFGTQKGKYAFVSYYYINCSSCLNLPILIHELVHILQFVQVGSPYAVRNLIAHLTPPTYDYGGLEIINKINLEPSLVHQLNYEQRADIFSDYCLISMGHWPEWGRAGLEDLKAYRQVIKILLNAK